MTFSDRCDAIEACYEFMLAYAAQGVVDESRSPSGAELRRFLGRAEAAIDGLAEACRTAVDQHGLSADQYAAFIDVLDRDAGDSLAALRLVLAQTSISSQLVDSLNASIHLRALLTDLFLVDDILKRVSTTQPK